MKHHSKRGQRAACKRQDGLGDPHTASEQVLAHCRALPPHHMPVPCDSPPATSSALLSLANQSCTNRAYAQTHTHRHITLTGTSHTLTGTSHTQAHHTHSQTHTHTGTSHSQTHTHTGTSHTLTGTSLTSRCTNHPRAALLALPCCILFCRKCWSRWRLYSSDEDEVNRWPQDEHASPACNRDTTASIRLHTQTHMYTRMHTHTDETKITVMECPACPFAHSFSRCGSNGREGMSSLSAPSPSLRTPSSFSLSRVALKLLLLEALPLCSEGVASGRTRGGGYSRGCLGS